MYLPSDGYWRLKIEQLGHPAPSGIWTHDTIVVYRTFSKQSVRFGYSFTYSLFNDAGSISDYKGGMEKWLVCIVKDIEDAVVV